MTSQRRPTGPQSPRLPHWLGEPAKETAGPLGDVASRIPAFTREPFGANPRFDVIARCPTGPGEIPLPTGLVSKRYTLVQHVSVIDSLVAALRAVDVEPFTLRCRMTLSESGARMATRVELPETFAFKAADGHDMALTFECFNSVDGTVPLFALLGWFRYVCSNGLTIGTTHARVRQQHRPPLRIDDLQTVLRDGLAAATRDRDDLCELMARPVSADAMRAWVDGPIAEAWGPFAASRVHAIATTGFDGDPSRTSPVGRRPHERDIALTTPVPGTHSPCADGYGIAQVLAWVAARRTDVAQRLVWRNQIPELIARVQ